VPLMKIGCCLILLFVKSICTDLDSLSFIRHFLVQIATLLRVDCLYMMKNNMMPSCTFDGNGTECLPDLILHDIIDTCCTQSYPCLTHCVCGVPVKLHVLI
jgi:hypothetical protein